MLMTYSEKIYFKNSQEKMLTKKLNDKFEAIERTGTPAYHS